MTATADRIQLVTFAVAGDRFATDIFSVERVLRYTQPRPVPNTPAWLLGVIDYRDRVVPVLDLRARLELPTAAPTATTRVLVFEVEGQWIGVLVDSVHEVATIARGDIEAPPALFRGLTKDYLMGLLRRSEGVVIVLDAGKLFTSQERLVLEQSGGAR
ncbi:MAG TPA: chemotaxis protein CheW [Gemmatimonadaceae bacterium]|nr:chemotaxis protein CheW [Gemmatimonadaceae bacterium]